MEYQLQSGLSPNETFSCETCRNCKSRRKIQNHRFKCNISVSYQPWTCYISREHVHMTLTPEVFLTEFGKCISLFEIVRKKKRVTPEWLVSRNHGTVCHAQTWGIITWHLKIVHSRWQCYSRQQNVCHSGISTFFGGLLAASSKKDWKHYSYQFFTAKQMQHRNPWFPKDLAPCLISMLFQSKNNRVFQNHHHHHDHDQDHYHYQYYY